MSNVPSSPVAYAFPHIQWDGLGSLRLTAQETALLRMAETNPIDYTLADSRDASMYARVLLKLLAEACAAGAGALQALRRLPPPRPTLGRRSSPSSAKSVDLSRAKMSEKDRKSNHPCMGVRGRERHDRKRG